MFIDMDTKITKLQNPVGCGQMLYSVFFKVFSWNSLKEGV
jgi:hypothetical protein